MLHKNTLILLSTLTIVSFIYATHLSASLVPKGYDLLFHLGNVFALQIKSGFQHTTPASLAISPLIFHDYGYGAHLFYPPLAHAIPAVISLALSSVGINSTLLAIRIFSFLTLFASGLTMFYTAKKITNHTITATFASLIYLSAPYLQMDYYWRGGMSSSLCFVFLPFLILSLFYFIKEKYSAFQFTFIMSMSLIMWTHLITAFYSSLFISSALLLNLVFAKHKIHALISLVSSELLIGLITSPFWVLLFQQYALKTHVIFSPEYPFTIEKVAQNTIGISSLFDIQLKVWEFKIRNIFAGFNLINTTLMILTILFFKQLKKVFKHTRLILTLTGLLAIMLIMTTTKPIWTLLPQFFAFIQYPHRLILQATPIISLIASLPFLLIRSSNAKTATILGAVAVVIVTYTFMFNNYQLYELGTIDYTTHSIIQAMGVEREYLPIKAKDRYDEIDEREYNLIALTNTDRATPSAIILNNETPYLQAEILDNESKQTEFELPRLFYAGYELWWQTDGSKKPILLDYHQSKHGLLATTITGNGILTAQYTGGRWYKLALIAAVTGSIITITLLIRTKRHRR